MSQYVLIAGVALELVGLIMVGVATAITYVKGNQAADQGTKSALHAAGIFLGISMIFALVALVTGFILLSTKGCSKRNRIIFLIFFILFAISYIISLVIIYVYWKRAQAAGSTSNARDLSSAFVLPIVAVILYIIGFILVYAVIGKKLRTLGKVCKKVKEAAAKVQGVTGNSGDKNSLLNKIKNA